MNVVPVKGLRRDKRLKSRPYRLAKDFRSNHLLPKALIASEMLLKEPTSFKEASKSEKWSEAMVEELKALAENETWELVPFNTSMNLVGCKWVYKLKKKNNGEIDRYKAHLVVQGFK